FSVPPVPPSLPFPSLNGMSGMDVTRALRETVGCVTASPKHRAVYRKNSTSCVGRVQSWRAGRSRFRRDLTSGESTMQSEPHAAILASLLCGFVCQAFSATVVSQAEGETCRLLWQGDERIEVSFARSQGLLFAPVTVRVDERSVSFDGFT